MSQKHTLDKLNSMDREELITIILTMQGQLDALNENIEKLIEQVRIANQNRFGRSTVFEKNAETNTPSENPEGVGQLNRC